MNYTLVVQSEAVIDIQEAFDWYEERQVGLGYEFIEELEEGFEKLCKHPQHYTAINQTYRRLRINRFPYLIIYEIEDTRLIVNTVRNTSQKPKH